MLSFYLRIIFISIVFSTALMSHANLKAQENNFSSRCERFIPINYEAFPVSIRSQLQNQGLTACVSEGNTAAVQQILDTEGADSNRPINDFNDSLLMLAALGDDANMVNTLLDAKAAPNAQNTQGITALMVASANGHLDIVTILLDAKAAPHISDRSGNTATSLTWKAINNSNNEERSNRLIEIISTLQDAEEATSK